MPSTEHLEVVVCAPIGRDSDLTVELLTRHGIPCRPCGSLAEVADQVSAGAGAVLLTEEALSDAHLDDLAAALASQPAWSDISVLLFTGSDRREPSLRTLHKLEVLRNVTLLDRPMRAAAVVSTVQAALRGRRRQYELRDVLLALDSARADAEEANRLKDEFLATISHELRTPLNAIMGWVSMLRQIRFEPARLDAILEIVDRNAKAQAQIVADILDISRMITGRMRLSLAPVSVARVARDAVDSIRPGAEAKGIVVCTDIDDHPVVTADAERLQQVLWNLLSNACKFTPAGGRIDVTLRADEGRAVLRVSDTGVGIAADFLPFVFDRFRQADQTFTRAHGGLGLGLSIVRHLVEMHGGTVVARSDGAGRGATFDVVLPLADATHAAPSPEQTPPDEESMPSLDLSGCEVLVVDDHEASRELVVAILESRGARVVSVASAEAAVSHFEIAVPSLLIADLGMPDEDGLSLIRRLRRRPPARGGTVPAIALSAYARAADRQAALDAGFDRFLAKPALPADILHEVAGVLAVEDVERAALSHFRTSLPKN